MSPTNYIIHIINNKEQLKHKTKLKSKPYSANKASWLQETCAGEGGVTREEAQRNVVLRVPQLEALFLGVCPHIVK